MRNYKYVRLYFTVDGKKYEVTGNTKAEAEEKKRKKLRQLEIGIPGDITVEEWCRTWLDTYLAPRIRAAGSPKRPGTMSPHSAYFYRYAVDLILPSIGKMPMTSIRDIHLQKILNSQQKSKSHSLKLRMVMHAIFSQAYTSRIIEHDPSQKLTLPADHVGCRRSITDYEREILLKVAEIHPVGLWIRVLLRTGMRPGEACALRVRNVDCENAVIHVVESNEAGSSYITTPKTRAGVRDVPILSDILPDLKRHIAGRDPDDLVFPRADGKVAAHGTRLSWWKSFAREMDLAMGAEHTPKGHIYDPSDVAEDGKPLYPDKDGNPRNGHKIAPDLVPYCLRHTFCTDMKRAGVPLATAKVIMGHDDIATTANIYMDTYEGEYLTALQLMNTEKSRKK